MGGAYKFGSAHDSHEENPCFWAAECKALPSFPCHTTCHSFATVAVLRAFLRKSSRHASVTVGTYNCETFGTAVRDNFSPFVQLTRTHICFPLTVCQSSLKLCGRQYVNASRPNSLKTILKLMIIDSHRVLLQEGARVPEARAATTRVFRLMLIAVYVTFARPLRTTHVASRPFQGP